MVPRRTAAVVLGEMVPAQEVAVMEAAALVLATVEQEAMAENLEEAVTVAWEETLGVTGARGAAE